MRDELDALIDRTAHAMTAAPLPSSLARDVQARIGPDRAAAPAWRWAVALAAAALLVFALWPNQPVMPSPALNARALPPLASPAALLSPVDEVVTASRPPSRSRRAAFVPAGDEPVPAIVSGPPALTIPPLDVDPMDAGVAAAADARPVPIMLEPLRVERLAQTEE